jgi:hypothetical protein
MHLSREIPRRTKTVRFNWIRKDFLEMTPRYRRIRSPMSYKGDCCYWCRHRFEDGEKMALGNIVKGPNRVLCHDCADKAMQCDTESCLQGEKK